ncbi:hypothetical protein [Rhizobium sp. ZPR3]|uniref:Uncharacterized protein n=2 Tax=unclassified Rhizobium TaxID=2613769 RepID=A0AAU7SB91_9HYPH
MTTYLNEKFPSAKRALVLTEDADGAEIVRVYLRDGQFATVLANDFAGLMSLGVSPNWFFNKDGDGKNPYVRASLSIANGWTGNLVSIARLVRPVPFGGITVRYKDGSTLNLRRDNLFVSQGRTSAKGREWSLVNAANLSISA